MKATLVYRTHFNAAYRTYNPNWSKEKNIHIFGTNAEKIAFKGHNYDIEIHLHGEVDPTTGTIMPIQELSQLIKENIEMRYDHRNLYDDVEDFRDTVPTPEMLAYRIWTILRPLIASQIAIKVIVYASSQQGAMYAGE